MKPQINQYDIWLANLNPQKGTKPGKVRPVVIVQTNLLNNEHPSTIVCPISTNRIPNAAPLRVAINNHTLERSSDILVDQLRAIDNRRLINPIGTLTEKEIEQLRTGLNIILELAY
jgi:mRNA interferase MazF